MYFVCAHGCLAVHMCLHTFILRTGICTLPFSLKFRREIIHVNFGPHTYRSVYISKLIFFTKRWSMVWTSAPLSSENGIKSDVMVMQIKLCGWHSPILSQIAFLYLYGQSHWSSKCELCAIQNYHCSQSADMCAQFVYEYSICWPNTYTWKCLRSCANSLRFGNGEKRVVSL